MAQHDHSTVGNASTAAKKLSPAGLHSRPAARRVLRSGAWLLAACSAAVILISACLGGHRELFQDESYVVWLDRPGWAHIAEFIRFEPSSPLFHYVTTMWIDLGGESEVWLRAQSGLYYLIAFPVIWWLARPTFTRSERFGIIVLLVACKSVGYYTIFVRFYEMMFLESCLILLCYLGLFNGRLPRGPALVLLALGNFLGIMTHYYFAFFLLGQGVAYLLFYRWRQLVDFVVGAVLPVVAFGIVWGPTFRAQLKSGRFEGNREPASLSILAYASYFDRRWYLILPSLLLLTLVAHRAGRWRLASVGQLLAKAGRFLADERVRVLAVLWAVSFVSPFLTTLILGGQFLKLDPVIMITTLSFVALLALAVDRSDRVLRIACGLVLVGFVGLIEARSRYIASRDGFPADGSRSVVDKMLKQGRDGDIIVCMDNYLTKIDYYARRSPTGVRAEIVGFPKELERRPGWTDPRDLKDMPAFRAKARQYALDVARTIEGRPGSRAWVLNAEWMPEISNVAFEAFDSVMARTGRIEAPGGVGFTEIVGFEPRRAKAGDAPKAD